MSRTLKRVPLDFVWPVGKTWPGYINTWDRLAEKCSACDGMGYSPTAKIYSDQWYGYEPFDPVSYGARPLTVDHPAIQERARRNCSLDACKDPGAIQREARRLHKRWHSQWCHNLIQADVDALVAEGRLWDFTRVPRTDEQRADCQPNGWTKEPNGYRPTAVEVNDWSLSGVGHDSINHGICVRARCAREGVELTCSRCAGHGNIFPPGGREMHDAWERTEPPTGVGFQLWRDDEPYSPVFECVGALAAYAANNCTTFGSKRATAERWLEMLEGDFVHHEMVDGSGNKLLLT